MIMERFFNDDLELLGIMQQLYPGEQFGNSTQLKHKTQKLIANELVDQVQKELQAREKACPA